MPSIVWFLLIGLVSGWLGGLIMRGRGFGIFGNIIVGIIGALLGGMVFDLFNITAGGVFGSILTATIGAVILLFIASLFRSGTHHRHIAT